MGPYFSWNVPERPDSGQNFVQKMGEGGHSILLCNPEWEGIDKHGVHHAERKWDAENQLQLCPLFWINRTSHGKNS